MDFTRGINNNNTNRMLDLDSYRNELQSRLRDNHLAYADIINKGTLKLAEVMIKSDSDEPTTTAGNNNNTNTNSQSNKDAKDISTTNSDNKTNNNNDQTPNQQQQQSEQPSQQTNLTNKNKRYWYSSKKHIFFDEPEIQLEYFKLLSASIQEPLKPTIRKNLYADQIIKRIESQMVLQNDSKSTKDKLISFFERRNSYLDIKKKKTLARFSCLSKSNQILPNADNLLMQRVGLLDMEIVHAEKRLERLKMDDEFSENLIGQTDNNNTLRQKPIAVNEKGDQIYKAIFDDEMAFSNLTREDFEIYCRSKLFSNMLHRDLHKFYYEAKWICYGNTNRQHIQQYVNSQLCESKTKSNKQWVEYYSPILDGFNNSANRLFPSSSQSDIQGAFNRIFSAMKEFKKEEMEYTELFYRYDLLPLWPSTKVEQNTLMHASYGLFFKDGVSSIKNQELQQVIFKMNLCLGIIFENECEVIRFERKDNIRQNEEEGNGQGGGQENNKEKKSDIDGRRDQNKKSKNDVENSNSNSGNRNNNNQGNSRNGAGSKLAELEEGALKTQIMSVLAAKKAQVLIKPDWVSLLDFQPTFDEAQQNVQNYLKSVSPLAIDPTTKLLVSLLGNRDFEMVKRFIAEQTKQIVEASCDKFFVFLENRKYTDRTHNSISFDLLVESYKHGSEQKQQKAFGGEKTMKLEFRDSLKPELLQQVLQVMKDCQPSDNALESAYGLYFLKALRHRRKILQILNAMRAIERRITYDLLRTFGCSLPQDIDDDFLVSLSEDKRDEKTYDSLFNKQKESNKKTKNDKNQTQNSTGSSDAFKSSKRANMQSLTDSKRFFDDKFMKSLDSSFQLGRQDHIVYKNELSMDEPGFDTIPDIYVKGDEKDVALFGYGKFIIFENSLNDLDSVEDRLIRMVSLLIDKFEKVNRVKNFFSIIDRFVEIEKAFDLECKYQFAKLRYMETCMVSMEHICDGKDSYDLAKKILNLRHEIPLIDFKANSFGDAYSAQIEALQLEKNYMVQLMEYQFNKEKIEVKRFHEKLQGIKGISHGEYFAFTEKNQGGSALSKNTNQLQTKQDRKLKQEQREQQQKLEEARMVMEKEESKKRREMMKEEILEKQGEIKKNQGEDDTGKEKIEGQWRDICQYDEYTLEKDMEEVFENILNIDELNQDNEDDDEDGKAGLFSSLEKQRQQGKTDKSKQERKTLHKKYEGGPQIWIHAANIPESNFSVSGLCEENFLNFAESMSLVNVLINLISVVADDLQRQLPQKSITGLLLARVGILQSLRQAWETFEFKAISNIEDNNICDDESCLEVAVQQLLGNILSTLERNNKDIELCTQTPRNLNNIQIQSFLQCVDSISLKQYLLREKIQNVQSYRELYLQANLLTFINTREKLLHCLWERRILHKHFKSQFQYLGITQKKHKDMYFLAPLDLSGGGAIPSKTAQLQLKNGQKYSKSPLSLFYEMDDCLASSLDFTSISSVRLMLMTDSLSELQQATAYEEINLRNLDNCVRLNTTKLDDILRYEIDVGLLLTKKGLPENHIIDLGRLYLTQASLMKIQQAVQSFKTFAGKNEFLFELKAQKQSVRLALDLKFREGASQISKRYKSGGDSSEIVNEILLGKELRSFRYCLLRATNADIMGELHGEWCRVESVHVTQQINRYLGCVPSLFRHVNIRIPPISQLEKQVYADQKEKQITPQQLQLQQEQAAKSQQEQTQQQQTSSVSQEQQFNQGETQGLTNIPGLLSISEILSRGRLENGECVRESGIRVFECSSENILQKMPLQPIVREKLTVIYNRGQKLKDRLLNHLKLPYAAVTQHRTLDFGQTHSMSSSSSCLSILAKYIKRVLELLQIHFVQVCFCLYGSELRVLQELLLFGMKYEEMSPEHEMEYAVSSQKDITNSLLSFEELQTAAMKDPLNQGNDSQNDSKNPRKITIVSNVIDSLVKRLQGFYNMEQSFGLLLKDLQMIYYVNNQANQDTKEQSPDKKSPPLHPKNTSQNLSTLRSQSSSYQVQASLNDDIELMLEGQFEKLSEKLKKRSHVLFCKIYLNLFEAFTSECQTNHDAPLPNSYFEIQQLLFAKYQQNQLNLKFFNTKFYNSNCGLQNTTIKAKVNGSNYSFNRLNHRTFKNTLNEPLLKLQVMIANLPLDFRKYLFKYQQTNQIKVLQAEQLFSQVQDISPGFDKIKLVKTVDLPAVGMQNYVIFNTTFISQILCLDEVERFSVAGKIRNFEKQLQYFKIYKNERAEDVDEELGYLQTLVSTRIISQANLIYKKAQLYPLIPLLFAQGLQQEREMVAEKIQEVKNNLEEYQKRRFQILNPRLLIPFSIELLNENQSFDRTYKQLLNTCLEKTFLTEEFENLLIQDSNSTLENEISIVNIWKNISSNANSNSSDGNNNNNPSDNLLPIQVNPYFSSPLFVDPKSYTIPSITKVSFVQGFINRLRNKVTRVDLLSSGFGFVVSVNDLEDCVSHLNMEIQEVCEKEIKKRVESAMFLYYLQNSKIKSLVSIVEQLKANISDIQKYESKYIEGAVHERGNRLIYELNRIKREQGDFQRYLWDVEDRVTEQVHSQHFAKINELTNDKVLLNTQFQYFKQQLTVTFVDQIKTAEKQAEIQLKKKNTERSSQIVTSRFQSVVCDENENFLGSDYINSFSPTFTTNIPLLNAQSTSAAAGIPQSQLFPTATSPSSFKQPNPSPFSRPSQLILQQSPGLRQYNSKRTSGTSYTSEVPRCAPDEDIITDPTYLTKIINKLRIFYLLKIAAQKQKYEQMLTEKSQEINSFKHLQSELIANKKEEAIVKHELVNIHNALKEQEKLTKAQTNEIEGMTFEKLKLEKNRDDLKKKVKQLDNELAKLVKEENTKEQVQQIGQQRVSREGQREKSAVFSRQGEYVQTEKTLNSSIGSRKVMLKPLQNKKINNRMYTEGDKTEDIKESGNMSTSSTSQIKKMLSDLQSQYNELQKQNQSLLQTAGSFADEVSRHLDKQQFVADFKQTLCRLGGSKFSVECQLIDVLKNVSQHTRELHSAMMNKRNVGNSNRFIGQEDEREIQKGFIDQMEMTGMDYGKRKLDEIKDQGEGQSGSGGDRGSFEDRKKKAEMLFQSPAIKRRENYQQFNQRFTLTSPKQVIIPRILSHQQEQEINNSLNQSFVLKPHK